ncbi:MAG: phage tail protein [Acidobacteria bacterium]|nr:phage tail protein [Acidobacteriota bacterium]
MGSPYIGEIRMFGGNFAPNGWMLCQGQLLAISENDTLFNLIGTTYGGDGQSTFALPDLQSRVPIHSGTGPDGSSYTIGQAAGTEQETLSINQIPQHNHAVVASQNAATATKAAGNVTASTNQLKIYTEGSASKSFAPTTISPVGGSQPHENTQPFLCVNFIISLFGIFPSQT